MKTAIAMLAVAAMAPTAAAMAADYTCNGLVPAGSRMICSGFEPNWAVELICAEPVMSSNFIDAFSGDGISETPGNATFSSQDPWRFETSHTVRGEIAFTPAGCTDESDRVFDFTFTPEAAPGLDGPFFPFCCRVEPISR